MRARGRRLGGGVQRRRRRRERGPACFSRVDAAGWLWPPRMTRANARGGGVFAWPHRRWATGQRPCRGSLTRAPLPRLAYCRPPSRNATRHATAASRADRCINAASPASNMHHLHQAYINCIKPASPASDLHHLHQTCITCITREPTASRVHHTAGRGIRMMWPLLVTMADPHHRAWLRTRRGAWGEYGATPAGAVRAPAVVQCDSARNRAWLCLYPVQLYYIPHVLHVLLREISGHVIGNEVQQPTGTKSRHPGSWRHVVHRRCTGREARRA